MVGSANQNHHFATPKQPVLFVVKHDFVLINFRIDLIVFSLRLCQCSFTSDSVPFL